MAEKSEITSLSPGKENPKKLHSEVYGFYQLWLQRVWVMENVRNKKQDKIRCVLR